MMGCVGGGHREQQGGCVDVERVRVAVGNDSSGWGLSGSTPETCWGCENVGSLLDHARKKIDRDEQTDMQRQTRKMENLWKANLPSKKPKTWQMSRQTCNKIDFLGHFIGSWELWVVGWWLNLELARNMVLLGLFECPHPSRGHHQFPASGRIPYGPTQTQPSKLTCQLTTS